MRKILVGLVLLAGAGFIAVSVLNWQGVISASDAVTPVFGVIGAVATLIGLWLQFASPSRSPEKSGVHVGGDMNLDRSEVIGGNKIVGHGEGSASSVGSGVDVKGSVRAKGSKIIGGSDHS